MQPSSLIAPFTYDEQAAVQLGATAISFHNVTQSATWPVLLRPSHLRSVERLLSELQASGGLRELHGSNKREAELSLK
jgi:hypothetical protein